MVPLYRRQQTDHLGGQFVVIGCLISVLLFALWTVSALSDVFIGGSALALLGAFTGLALSTVALVLWLQQQRRGERAEGRIDSFRRLPEEVTERALEVVLDGHAWRLPAHLEPRLRIGQVLHLRFEPATETVELEVLDVHEKRDIVYGPEHQ
jgi:hypothetical protein